MIITMIVHFSLFHSLCPCFEIFCIAMVIFPVWYATVMFMTSIQCYCYIFDSKCHISVMIINLINLSAMSIFSNALLLLCFLF